MAKSATAELHGGSAPCGDVQRNEWKSASNAGRELQNKHTALLCGVAFSACELRQRISGHPEVPLARGVAPPPPKVGNFFPAHHAKTLAFSAKENPNRSRWLGKEVLTGPVPTTRLTAPTAAPRWPGRSATPSYRRRGVGNRAHMLAGLGAGRRRTNLGMGWRETGWLAPPPPPPPMLGGPSAAIGVDLGFNGAKAQ